MELTWKGVKTYFGYEHSTANVWKTVLQSKSIWNNSFSFYLSTGKYGKESVPSRAINVEYRINTIISMNTKIHCVLKSLNLSLLKRTQVQDKDLMKADIKQKLEGTIRRFTSMEEENEDQKVILQY